MGQREMIRELVDFSVNAALRDRDNLREVFEKGFPGFLNMPKNKLIQELQFRGILDYEEDDDDVISEEEQSDEELMVMLSEMTSETGAYFD